MAAMRGPRLQVGSAAWVAEERSSALQIVETEVEEFSYSARNEMDWLNEHMAGIFDENETNFAENFKTPGKLRGGKTPRTTRKTPAGEVRVPLSDVFAGASKGISNQFGPRLSRAQSPLVRSDTEHESPRPARISSPRKAIASTTAKPSQTATQDSGYYGSQDIDNGTHFSSDILGDTQSTQPELPPLPKATEVQVEHDSIPATTESPKKATTLQMEVQSTRNETDELADYEMEEHVEVEMPPQISATPGNKVQRAHDDGDVSIPDAGQNDAVSDADASPSEASSPVRPMVRKSSLNFASLPAREPLTAVKPNGARVSGIGHQDHKRVSYYGRPTGGKSIGNAVAPEFDDADMDEEMDGAAPQPSAQTKYEDLAADHHKTYTQRLQDQISLLGKSQAHAERTSKSNADTTTTHKQFAAVQAAQAPKSPSPLPMSTLKSTPGAFPDDEDDWIEPPTVQKASEKLSSPRPPMSKSNTTEIMDGIHLSAVTSESEPTAASDPGLTVASDKPPQASLHSKSASISERPVSAGIEEQTVPLQRAATVSHLVLGAANDADLIDTPLKSPARSFRDSPLKHVKNKFSSILKSSKGLLASSAAISAEGKSSILSPSTTKLGFFPGPSSESLVDKPKLLSHKSQDQLSSISRPASPTRPIGKRTRASTEREKEEKKRDKETRRLGEQEDKLEKAREKEREKARVFSKEQAKAAERQLLQSQQAVDELSQTHKTPKPTRTSPRRQKAADDAPSKQTEQDIDMAEAPSALPQPAPRSVGPASALRTRELKRPMKPVKETLSKTRQAPTVIRVNTGSQHSQYHGSNRTSSAVAMEPDVLSAPTPQHQSSSKASKASLQSKPSAPNPRTVAPPSVGRPKALDAAAKKREQDEREAQRRRDAKVELEKKRAAAQEEQRKAEQQRRNDAERQKLKEREQQAQAEAKKMAQRQAAIEKAKQTKAPPPAVRSQTNALQELTNANEKRTSALLGHKSDAANRPASRMTSGLPRSQEELGRSIHGHNSNVPKAQVKRTLPTESAEDSYRSNASRAGNTYQAKDAKRLRTSDEHDDKYETSPPHIKGPPVRPSNGFKKDVPSKPAYATGYATQGHSATRDLFKATVTAQHHGQSKPAHPLDMAQSSKGAIVFAPQGNSAGHPTKTPVRTTALGSMKASAAKSTVKASPKFQNGEAIELPEIQTSDEEDDDDGGHGGMVAAWADSPDLRRALLRQETLDPSHIFGPPAPLNMEEVFVKSKEKFHKFRNRTSSANWTGADRLTEEDIRKDLAARDKLRREGGWTYEMSKNLL